MHLIYIKDIKSYFYRINFVFFFVCLTSAPDVPFNISIFKIIYSKKINNLILYKN
jgi:hypothetical protein